MKVFELYPIGESEDVAPKSSDDWQVFSYLDGTPRLPEWTPIEVELITEDIESGAVLRRADFPWMGSYTLFLRDHAIEQAAPILAPFGELLPVTCSDALLAGFNALQILDAFDDEKSDVERFDDGDIMMVDEYVFREDAIPERAIFKIPEMKLGPVLYTEPIVRDLNALGLDGLDWNMLWDSSDS